MSASRSTLAMTEAAAMEAQRASPLHHIDLARVEAERIAVEQDDLRHDALGFDVDDCCFESALEASHDAELIDILRRDMNDRESAS